MNTRAFLLAAGIAGVAIGVLGNLPLLNLINCFLCVWVWLGGAFAVFLYRRLQPAPPRVSTGQGAGLGAFAGLIGAFVGAVVYAATSFISMPIFMSVAQMLEIEGDLPFASVEPASVLGSTFVFFILDAVLYPLFGMISGMIAASLMRGATTEPVSAPDQIA